MAAALQTKARRLIIDILIQVKNRVAHHKQQPDSNCSTRAIQIVSGSFLIHFLWWSKVAASTQRAAYRRAVKTRWGWAFRPLETLSGLPFSVRQPVQAPGRR